MHHAGHHVHRSHAAGHNEPPRRSWTVLVLLAVMQFMVILDVTVVNVALPTIGEDLSVAPDDLQWVVTAYVLFTGGLMLLAGRIGDLVGRKATLLAGLGVFTAASLASGLAWSAESLIAARAVQGIGAAFLLPSALSVLTTSYDGRQRAVALGVWGALGSAGAAAGVLLGGVLITVASWEWIFFINLPIGVAVGLLAAHRVADRQRTSTAAARADLVGGAALMAGLVGLVLAIDGAAEHGWTSGRTLGLFAVATAVLAGFAAVERTTDRPLVPPATWRVASLVSSAAVMLIATGVLVGAFFLNTLMMQRVLDLSALETGLGFLPLTIVILAGARSAAHALPRHGSRTVMTVGFLLGALGAVLLSGVPADAAYASDLLPGFLVLGFGIGMVFVSASVAAMADVAHDQAGLASGLMTTAHELGAAIGVAALAAIATARTDLVGGYHDAFLAVAGVTVATAVLASAAMPSVRPAAGAAHTMH